MRRGSPCGSGCMCNTVYFNCENPVGTIA
jgi:hypothetical protein